MNVLKIYIETKMTPSNKGWLLVIKDKNPSKFNALKNKEVSNK